MNPETEKTGDSAETSQAKPQKQLTPAAQRALAEAEERRRRAVDPQRPAEFNGRDGPDPVRYGDWESKGIASDF